MKSIGTQIYSYFSLKYPCYNKFHNVRFISPQNKLKINHSKTKEILTLNNNDYISIKKLGKEYCFALIKHNLSFCNMYNKYKKNDDLADSFLQGFHFLFCHNNVISHKYLNIFIELNNSLQNVKNIKSNNQLLLDLSSSLNPLL